MSFDRTTLEFKSGGIDCAGWFYRPQGNGPFPGVAMAHGLGVVKEVDIEPFAQSFAAAGIATLLFDYRYWGDSGGEPRCQAMPSAQIDDYRSALTRLSIHSDIDEERLGVWGTSFSGGLVLELAAYDRRVKAVVSQVPALDLYASGRRLEMNSSGVRRRWTLEEKHRIVAESCAGSRLVSATARRYGLSASQLFRC